MLSAAHELLAEPQGWLYLYGGPGNAKTVGLKALVNELAARGYTARYIKFTRLLNFMREAYSERDARRRYIAKATPRDEWEIGGYEARFQRILSIPVLAIDEFDKGRLTDFAEEFRFDFLDERYDQALKGQTVTLFASNSPPTVWPSPIASRLGDGRFRVVQVTAGDARPVMSREKTTQNDER